MVDLSKFEEEGEEKAKGMLKKEADKELGENQNKSEQNNQQKS